MPDLEIHSEVRVCVVTAYFGEPTRPVERHCTIPGSVGEDDNLREVSMSCSREEFFDDLAGDSLTPIGADHGHANDPPAWSFWLEDPGSDDFPVDFCNDNFCAASDVGRVDTGQISVEPRVECVTPAFFHASKDQATKRVLVSLFKVSDHDSNSALAA